MSYVPLKVHLNHGMYLNLEEDKLIPHFDGRLILEGSSGDDLIP